MFDTSPGDENDIPDLTKLLTCIEEVVVYCETPEMLQFEKNDPSGFEAHVGNRYPYLYDHHYGIFKSLTIAKERSTSLKKILDMICVLEEVKSGRKTMKQADTNFREEMAEQFIYSKHGGRENFEKNILKRAAAKKSK